MRVNGFWGGSGGAKRFGQLRCVWIQQNLSSLLQQVRGRCRNEIVSRHNGYQAYMQAYISCSLSAERTKDLDVEEALLLRTSTTRAASTTPALIIFLVRTDFFYEYPGNQCSQQNHPMGMTRKPRNHRLEMCGRSADSHDTPAMVAETAPGTELLIRTKIFPSLQSPVRRRSVQRHVVPCRFVFAAVPH